VAAERVADFGHGPVGVVGGGFDDEGHATGAIALVGHLFIGGAFELAGALLDGALDVVVGHVDRAGGVHRQAQARIPGRITAAGPRGDGDLADDLGPGRGAALVGHRFLALDLLPLAVPGHAASRERPKLSPAAARSNARD
jgi:hypothetical protein